MRQQANEKCCKIVNENQQTAELSDKKKNNRTKACTTLYIHKEAFEMWYECQWDNSLSKLLVS